MITAFTLPAMANVAQPGLWGGGGSNPFALLYESEREWFQQIQMKEEQITIQLFPGFAAVKGVYHMYNPLDTTIQLHTGYPKMSVQEYQGKGVHKMDISYDELYQMQVFVNDSLIGSASASNLDYSNDDWVVWDMPFAPDTITTIEVYFLMRTDGATIIDGYDKVGMNGFVYVLETGALWKAPIEKGSIVLNPVKVPFETIFGVYPDSIFEVNDDGSLWRYQFTDLHPTSENNIAIVYEGKEAADFEQVVEHADLYYRDLDQLEESAHNQKGLKAYQFDDPFDLGKNTMQADREALEWVFYIGGGCLLLVTLVWMRMLWQNRKKKREGKARS